MQNNRRNLGIAIIIIGFILILIILYFGFFKKAEVTPVDQPVIVPGNVISPLPTEPSEGTTTPSDKPSNRQTYDISQEPIHKINANDLAKRAMLYGERFGSFSSQSNYGNFTDLKIYMTDGFREWTDKYVAELKAKNQGTVYYGIETKALTTEIKEYNEASGKARIIVSTERRESTEKIGGGEPFIQKLDLSFLRVNNEWLMDKAYWIK